MVDRISSFLNTKVASWLWIALLAVVVFLAGAPDWVTVLTVIWLIYKESER